MINLSVYRNQHPGHGACAKLVTHIETCKVLGLITGDDTKWAKNSKGQMKPVKEVGWAAENEIPTHMVLQFDSSHGGAYIGSVGNTLWVDNVRVEY